MSKKDRSRQSEAQRRRKSLDAISSALFASIILRAAEIEADGNDTSGKLESAVKKLSKKGGAA